jgi:aminopeptidase N
MASPLRASCAILLLLAACGAPPALRAPYAPLPYRPPAVDVLDYDVAVDIRHRAGFVDGHVDVLFAALAGGPTTELGLDAVDMDVSGVWDEMGRELSFRNDGRTLRIELAEPLAPGARAVVGIDYTCSPRRGMYFVGPTAADPGVSWQVWTQGQTQDTRHWFPCWDQLDDLATHTLRVTVDGGFRTMAAGTLEHSVVSRATGRRTDTWRMDVPHAVSLVTLVAGALAHGELPSRDVPLPVVAEHDMLPHALRNLAVTADALDFLAEYTGRPYPYPKYAQCCVKEFRAGGMENVSATTLYHEGLHDPAHDPQASAVDLVVHEVAHQWFGDLIGCRDWGEVWLNEGLATYAEALWFGHAEGPERMAWWLLRQQRQGVDAELAHSRPIVWHGWTDPDEMFDGHAYPAAAMRLHLLADVLGADVFREGVRRYVAEHASKVVVTADLRAAFEAASGRDLRRFFDEWLLGPGFPEFVVDVTTGEAGQPVVRAEQVQSGRGWREVFHLPVTVAWSRGGVEHVARLDVARRVETLQLGGDGALDWVRFDAGTTVPGTVDLAQPEASWRRQLASARNAITRLLAAEWFAHSPWVRRRDEAPAPAGPEALAALRRAATEDASVPVRVAAIEALSVQADAARAADTADTAGPGDAADAAVADVADVADDADDAENAALLLALLGDDDARVRAAAAAALADCGDDAVLPGLVAAVEDTNQSVAAAALWALAERGYPGTFSLCEAVAARTQEHRLDRAVVRIVAGLEDEDRALPFLTAAARYEPVPRVRAAAVEALAGRDDPYGTWLSELTAALHDPSFLVRAAAAGALGRRGDAAAREQLRARAAVECDASVLGALDAALR